MIISVVLPCRNEEKHIVGCIEAIYGSELDQDTSIEVLVIDGRSDDGTLSVLEDLQKKYKSLQIIVNERKVTPVAFNLGINSAKGEYIQIIGARQIISSNYLLDAVKTLKGDESIWCVGGKVLNVYQNSESEIIGLAMGSSFGVGGGNFRILKESNYTDTVGTPMYPKKVFDKIGLFNENLLRNQDDELNFRLTKSGGKIFFNTDIEIKYYVRANLSNLYKQYYQYGYWKVYVNRLHKSVTSVRQLIPLIFVLGIIIGAICSFIIQHFFIVYLSGIILYLLLSLFFGISMAKNIVKGVQVARVFPILHFSYGWGYLVAIIHFLILRKEPTKNAASLSR